MTIKTALAIAGCAMALTVAAYPAAKADTDKDGFIRIKQGEEQYKNPFGVGVEVATLFGDPSKPGIYVLRIKWPPGIMSKPHKHPEDRHVVVLSGTWYTGTGDAFEPEKAIPLKTGAKRHACTPVIGPDSVVVASTTIGSAWMILA